VQWEVLSAMQVLSYSMSLSMSMSVRAGVERSASRQTYLTNIRHLLTGTVAHNSKEPQFQRDSALCTQPRAMRARMQHSSWLRPVKGASDI
jgi:hypothetical protein